MNPSDVAEVLKQCIERGFALPLTLTAVGVNGSVLVVRYVASDDGEHLQAEPLAEHTEGAGFAMPMNIMIVDSAGEAARIVLERHGEQRWLN